VDLIFFVTDPDLTFHGVSDPDPTFKKTGSDFRYDLKYLFTLSPEWLSLMFTPSFGTGSKSSSYGSGHETSSYGSGNGKKFRVLTDPDPDPDPQH
jgi:hypothetical protein